jgi:hypothetical protein
VPNDPSTRAALARPVGADGDPLLAWVPTADTSFGPRALPALEARRRIWRQPDARWPVPGLATLRGRTSDAQAPAAVRLASPDDLEARDSRQRAPYGVGYQGHLTASCDGGPPELMTPSSTTPATTPDGVMGPAMVHD